MLEEITISLRLRIPTALALAEAALICGNSYRSAIDHEVGCDAIDGLAEHCSSEELTRRSDCLLAVHAAIIERLTAVVQ